MGTESQNQEPQEDYATRLGLTGQQAEKFRSLSLSDQEHLFVHISGAQTVLRSGSKKGLHGNISLETGEITVKS